MSLEAYNPHLDDDLMLDVYAEGGVSPVGDQIDALATISAGKRGANFPTVSREGEIFLHDPEGRAPGLAALLAKDPKRLTIALPYEDKELFMQSRFTRYSATRLEVYGDAESLVEIKVVKPAQPAENGKPKVPAKTERLVHKAGTAEFERLKATCAVSHSLYFGLARWKENYEAEVYFPDGLALYRLRFGSPNSYRNIMGQIAMVRRFTGGRVAGIPLDLSITYREKISPSGEKRTVPLWTLNMKPLGQELTTRTVRLALEAGMKAVPALQIPPPRRETLGDAATDIVLDVNDLSELEGPRALPPAEISERDMRQLTSGVRYETITSSFFALVKDTPLDTDEARAEIVLDASAGVTSSLRDFLEAGADPNALFQALSRRLATLRQEEVDAEYREQVSSAEEADRKTNADVKSYGSATELTPEMVALLERVIARLVEVGLSYRDRLEFVGWLASRKIEGNAALTPDDVKLLKEATYEGNRPKTSEYLKTLVDNYDVYAKSDEGLDWLNDGA